jgi:hypothetical protein
MKRFRSTKERTCQVRIHFPSGEHDAQVPVQFYHENLKTSDDKADKWNLSLKNSIFIALV